MLINAVCYWVATPLWLR